MNDVAREGLLARAVRILETFDSKHPSLTVAEVARRAGLPAPTTYRLVNELLGQGLLARTPDRRVRIGLRMWELTSRSSETARLRDVAVRFMDDLHSVTRQHTCLAVLEGRDALYIERRVVPGGKVPMDVPTAGRLPAHACSAGHVLLAHRDAGVQDQVLSPHLKPLTPRTCTKVEELRRRMADVPERGYAVVNGWVRENATGVSAPVRGPGGDVVAALSVVLPTDQAMIAAVMPALLATARGITHAFAAGGTSPRVLRFA